MEHTNHPFRKENDLPTSMIMVHVNLQGCSGHWHPRRKDSDHVPRYIGDFFPTFCTMAFRNSYCFSHRIHA